MDWFTFPSRSYSFIRQHALSLLLLLGILAVGISINLFSNKSMMSISWTFPYFSGAANFERLFDWQISPTDYDIASKLSSHDYLNYRHQKTVETISYGLNSYGYVLVALLSRLIFYWAGDVQSLSLIHI